MQHAFAHTNKIPAAIDSDKKWWRWPLYFLLFLLAFLFIIRHFKGLEKDFLLLEKVRPWWLLAALLAQLTTYFAAALIYRMLLPARYRNGLQHFASLVRASVVALFFNQTVPSASLSGGVFIYRFLRQWRIPPQSILLMILSELFVYYLAVEISLLGLLLSGITLFSIKHLFVITLSLGLLAYPLLAFFLWIVSQKKTVAFPAFKAVTLPLSSEKNEKQCGLSPAKQSVPHAYFGTSLFTGK